MHNHNNKKEPSMLWMMLPCLLLAGVLLFGGNTFASSGYFWLILVGVCVVPHIWMMCKGHGGHGDDNGEETANMAFDKGEAKDEHNEGKHGGCCQ